MNGIHCSHIRMNENDIQRKKIIANHSGQDLDLPWLRPEGAGMHSQA